eukprot:TRINITY_DN8778_c0_g1_i1.p1 TRINITY_DN8778_c0_g1~~TRINITY_DN8778_c0_g1_i1.p1  ORF type:complete len:373 (+),score=41.21 TRINITY_DN8778_c0_g1_i1:153-1271(+)
MPEEVRRPAQQKRPAESSLEEPRVAKKSNIIQDQKENRERYFLRPRNQRTQTLNERLLNKQTHKLPLKQVLKPITPNQNEKKNQSKDDVKAKGKNIPSLPAVEDSPMPDVDRDVGAQYVPVYAASIFNTYKEVEGDFMPKADYMETVQTSLKPRFRGVLIDWLVEVHFKFKMMPETIFLTVNIIDRYLSVKEVPKDLLQLVGCTSLFIASKYEEIYVPQIKDLVKICDDLYTREQLIMMEKHILRKLDYNLTVPTAYYFMLRYLKIAKLLTKKHTAYLAFYLVELAMVTYEMIKYKPSMVSVAAIHVAMKTMGCSDCFPRELRKHSGYTLESLQECVGDLVRLQMKASENSTRCQILNKIKVKDVKQKEEQI